MFGRKKKKNTNLDPLLGAELDAGMHVMRDDLDELSGKQNPKKTAVSTETPLHATGSESPFLSGGASSSAAPPASSDKDTIVFDNKKGRRVAEREAENRKTELTETRKKVVSKRDIKKAEWSMPERKAPEAHPTPQEKQKESGRRPQKKESVAVTKSRPKSPDQAPADLPVSPFLSTQAETSRKKIVPDTASEQDSGDLKSVLASLGSHEQTVPPPRSTPNSVHSRGEQPSKLADEMTPKAPEAPKVRSIPSPPVSHGISVRSSRWVLPVAILLLLMIVIGAAGYLYFMPDSEPAALETTPESPESEAPDKPESSESAESQPDPFSQETPNILTLDTESADLTPGGIKRLLTDTETEVRSMNPSSPVEFVIRDANNNPVAFSRLAFLLELSIPSDVLASFDESFSIYFVMDGDEAYRALSIDIRDEETTTLLRAEEADMPEWFRGLLYDDAATLPTAPEFSDGSYGTLETRFVNFDASNLSLDYAALDGSLIIGTSKDSFRAALGSVLRIR